MSHIRATKDICILSILKKNLIYLLEDKSVGLVVKNTERDKWLEPLNITSKYSCIHWYYKRDKRVSTPQHLSYSYATL